ncbi:MAG: BON domain-containing protein [Acidobacteria bacterium]|nr:BON domain-containing protein [Acidobacteriota bacterium]
MTKFRTTLYRSTLALLVLGAPAALLNPSASAQTSSTQPNDSAQNKNAGLTADNQPNSTNDLKTTAAVRKAIIADKSLTMDAYNVKIITRHGTVTLKGPVKSDRQKQQVDNDATQAAPSYKIVDQMTVKQ